MREDEHIVPRKDYSWGVKVAGGERASKIFRTRIEAIDYARELSIKHNVCMVVHDEEGKFEEFDCKPEFKNRHVVKKIEGWSVIAEGGTEVERIFDKFYRADTSNVAVEGIGLGMGISKHIVEVHCGKIWVKSIPGEGTAVKFTIPLETSTDIRDSHS